MAIDRGARTRYVRRRLRGLEGSRELRECRLLTQVALQQRLPTQGSSVLPDNH